MEWTGPEVRRPDELTGVSLFCPLAALDLFDIVWDVMLDLMHTVKNFWEARIIPTFKGERCPKKRPSYKSNPQRIDHEAKVAEQARADVAYTILHARHKLCTLTKPNQDKVDRRIKNLCGQPDWINPTLVPFNTIEGQRKPKVTDWLCFQRTCVEYAFNGVVPVHAREAFFGMVDALNAILELTADYNPELNGPDDHLRECQEVQRKVVGALVAFERDFPNSELSPCIHWIIHAAGELVPRWNNVRNYWCFLPERFVGWMKYFVKNRSLALPNMVRGYCRGLMILAVGPHIRKRLMRRMRLIGIDTAGLRSFLDPPRARGKTVGGTGEVGYATHTRNSAKTFMSQKLKKYTTAYLESLRPQLVQVRLKLQTTHITNRICINGRYLKAGAVAEFQDHARISGRMVMVGDVLSFAVINYTNSLRQSPRSSRMLGEAVMVRVMVHDPPPHEAWQYVHVPNRAHNTTETCMGCC